MVQEEIDSYIEKGGEYNLGNQAAALAGSHFKNSDVAQLFGRLAPVGWQSVVGESGRRQAREWWRQ